MSLMITFICHLQSSLASTRTY